MPIWVVSRNNLRLQINTMKIFEYAKFYKKKPYLVQSKDLVLSKGKYGPVNNILYQELMSLDDMKTNRLPTLLYLVQSCKYLLTTNSCTKIGLVNGSECILHAIQLEKTEPCSITTDDNQHEIFVFNTQPLILICELLADNDKFQFPNLKPNYFPIAIKEDQFEFKSKIINKNFKIKRKQFPLIPSFCYTIYKAQGKTFDKAKIDLALPPNGNIHSSYSYVALSRCKDLKNLYILREFDERILFIKQNDDLLIE